MSVQLELFKQLKKRLPEHISLVDDLAELLNISNDSAYRRLRGETNLTLDELLLMSKAYKFSLDTILGKDPKANKVTLYYEPVEEDGATFYKHFESIISLLKTYADLKENSQLIYAANEAKFGLFQIPELAAFKLFFWEKTSYSFQASKDKKYDFASFEAKYANVLKRIIATYVRIPTIEIINKDYLNSTINQIKFYYESGFFNSRAEALMICEKLQEFIEHNKKEAELGFKFIKGSEPVGKEGNLMLFHNEVIYSDNLITSRIEDQYFTYLIVNTVNFMITGNQKFSKHTYDYLINLKNKSTLISVSAERERNMFFNSLTKKVDELKSSI